MDYLLAIVLILGGIVALSGLIALKRPDLKPQLDQLVPFKALIGIGLIILAIINFAHMAGALFDAFKLNQIFAASVWTMLGSAILLGFLFAFPVIANAMAQSPQAAARMKELSDNIAMFQMLIGAVGIAASLVYILFATHIIPMKGGFINDIF